MQKIKLDIAKNHALQWHDFTILPGMIKGIDENGDMFVTTGRSFNSRRAMNIHVVNGKTVDGKNNWTKKVITVSTRPELLNAILKFAERRDKRDRRIERQNIGSFLQTGATIKNVGVRHLSKAEHEAERWGKREFDNGTVIHGNCKSNHYLFSTDRIGKERRVDRRKSF